MARIMNCLKTRTEIEKEEIIEINAKNVCFRWLVFSVLQSL